MTFQFQDYWYMVRQKNKGYNLLIFLSEVSSLQMKASHYSRYFLEVSFSREQR